MNDSKALHIILIDDEPSVLLALKLLLKALGYEVSDFGRPTAALKYLEEGGMGDVVLSDLRMPELDGIEVLQRVKRFNAAIPFILISGHATEEDVTRAKSLGAIGVLGKPFSPDDLRQVLQEI